jgi:chemotaxis protein methyltransferase CheR
MYFDAACQKKVIERLHRSLVPGGWFIPGLTEISMAFSPPFEFVKFPEGMFCKKGVKKAQQQTAVAAAVRYEDAASIPPAAGMPPHRSSLKGPAGSPLQAGQWGRSDTSHRDMDAGFLPGDALEKNAETVAQEVNPTAGPDKRLEEARAVFQKKQYDEVVRLLSNPAGNRPAESHVLLARAHANCGRLGEALKAADAATAADKLNAEAYYVRALVLQEQGHVEQAHEALKQTLYLEPDHILAHVNQGQIAGRLGKQALSRKHLRNAIGLLQSLPPDCEVPDSDGLTASQFVGILKKEVFRS